MIIKFAYAIICDGQFMNARGEKGVYCYIVSITLNVGYYWSKDLSYRLAMDGVSEKAEKKIIFKTQSDLDKGVVFYPQSHTHLGQLNPKV